MIFNYLLKCTTNTLKTLLSSHKIHTKCLNTLSSTQTHPKSDQNIVIDLGFDDQMTAEECHRLARDLYAIYCLNCESDCNETKFKVNVCHQLSENSLTIVYLSQYLSQIQSNDNFLIHNKSYLDLFGRQRLLYLSPDAKQVIDFNENDVYIIGGIVEKHVFRKASNRLTYLKAQREGLRVGRLPIDHYISDNMKRGVVLFLPQVFGILSDVKDTQDWESAVRKHLPNWKLKSSLLESYRCS